MTYEQADELRNKHRKLTGKQVKFSKPPFYIRYLLIAPIGGSHSLKLEVLNENIYKPIDNKTALRNLKLLEKTLSVFLIGGETAGQRDGETLHIMDLEVFFEKFGEEFH